MSCHDGMLCLLQLSKQGCHGILAGAQAQHAQHCHIVQNPIVALDGIVGAEEACPSKLSQQIHCQHLLQCHLSCFLPFAAAPLFLWNGFQSFVVFHEFSAIPFIVHVVGSIHENYGAHFFQSGGIFFLRYGTVCHGVPFVGGKSVLQGDFSEGGIHGC